MRSLAASLRLPWLPVFGLVLLAAMRWWWLDAYPLNSDEAQHAHVAWSWTQGWTIYRDTFDNHGPLFSWLNSWLMRLIGEREDVLYWLRLAMQLWYALALWAVWRMGRRMFGPGLAWAGMFLAAVELRFFLISGQFRTDDMWAAAWLCALAAVVGAPSRAWRWFLFGCGAGVAIAVSQKTVVLLATSAVSALLVCLAVRPSTVRFRARHAAAALLGFMIVPGAFVLWLGWHGLLGNAWYALVTYNVGGVSKTDALAKLLLALMIYAGLTLAVMRYLRADAAPGFDGPAFLFLQSSGYLLLVWFVWPLVTAQDFLPAIPPLMLVLCAAFAQVPWLDGHPARRRFVAVTAVLVECAFLFALQPPWHDRMAPQREALRTVLRYTDKGDTVMDPKGDAIFRRRAHFSIIESLAMVRMREGLLHDSVAGDMVREGSMLVFNLRLPPASEAFVWKNFLPVEGDIWMAGQCVGQGMDRNIVVGMPGDYTLVDASGSVPASMDGLPLSDHWKLAAGRHQLRVEVTRPLALVWTRAWQRGWRPVSLAPADAGHPAAVVVCH
ncbi:MULTISPECIES: ArnT family glycosyltransferase [Dyella]|uniref:Glycosyltransferase RgtA/B/C/D-like domain-containing protein n=2 Tax=Dyella TaxID=231454 RepID=A0A4R0YUW2_9GAMM|nr:MULTISPECIES: glycosyltransferase family 39 protein [Dyella]TBR39198.1 hypothetical protein EYV96_02905 [Dyella terrae]TCI13215.1 hypothetical protein EZM97_07960 [Dyella soli]